MDPSINISPNLLHIEKGYVKRASTAPFYKNLHQIRSFGRIDIFFFLPVKAEIEEKKMVEISTGNTPEISTSNTPKSPYFLEKCTFFIDISSLKIEVVEISGGNKK